MTLTRSLPFYMIIPLDQTFTFLGRKNRIPCWRFWFGKSTTISLFCRFYDPPSGSVNFGGVALHDLNLKLARKMSASAITHKSYCPRPAQNVRSVTNIEVESRCIQVIHRL